ncbi:MAG: hypothetical protein MJ245_00945 [Clostridia bacterium]|nr:hypothetical protein [Clostridia bacterium]
MKSKIFIAFGIMLCLGGTVLAAAGLDPGSSNDPLVTKSYVDSLMESKGTSSSEYEIVQLAAGKTILGHAGCEIILRSGEARINSFFAADGTENGVQDITDGVDLKNAVKCPSNHLLLIPRTDTRGITTTTEVFVMVRGDYEIKNN